MDEFAHKKHMYIWRGICSGFFFPSLASGILVRNLSISISNAFIVSSIVFIDFLTFSSMSPVFLSMFTAFSMVFVVFFAMVFIDPSMPWFLSICSIIFDGISLFLHHKMSHMYVYIASSLLLEPRKPELGW